MEMKCNVRGGGGGWIDWIVLTDESSSARLLTATEAQISWRPKKAQPVQ